MKFNTPISYVVSKTGILGFSRYLATYLAKNNIRVNSISPGAIKSSNSKDLTNNSVFKSRYLKKTPIKRLGKPSDISSSVIFLSSDASNYITGINLVIDGGYTIT